MSKGEDMVMPRKVTLTQWNLDDHNTMILPTVVKEQVDPEQVVRRFLRHLNWQSVEKFIFVDITTPLVGPMEMRVACACGCERTFIRKVNTLQQAYYTTHVMNEVVWRITFLPRFVKEQTQ